MAYTVGACNVGACAVAGPEAIENPQFGSFEHQDSSRCLGIIAQSDAGWGCGGHSRDTLRDSLGLDTPRDTGTCNEPARIQKTHSCLRPLTVPEQYHPIQMQNIHADSLDACVLRREAGSLEWKQPWPTNAVTDVG